MIAGGPIARHAAERPLAIAISFNEESISWRALESLLQRAATWINAHSPATAPVAIHLPHSPALALIFLAAARLGREAQIFDTQWPAVTIGALVEELKPGLVITGEAPPQYPVHICLPPGALGLNGFSEWLKDSPAIGSWPVVDAETDFYTGFTSGATGLPKGYRRNHRSWIASFEAAQREFRLSPSDVILAPGTLTHSLFLFALAYAMHTGACCVMIQTFRPDHVLETARKHAATVMFCVPAQLGLIARNISNIETAIASLRWLISSGSKWRDKDDPCLRKLFSAAHFSEFYGASETSFVSVAHAHEGAPETSVGRAFHGVNITIRDAEGGRLPAGTHGRIFVNSPMLFSGYATGAVSAATSEDGAICTGDIGFLDAKGLLYLSGRENRMIVTSGKNLFPEEVEAVLEALTGVRTAAVIGVADDKRGEKPVGIVQFSSNGGIKRAALISHARQHLPLFKIPREYFVAIEWPLTRSGKTDFSALNEMWRCGSLRRVT